MESTKRTGRQASQTAGCGRTLFGGGKFLMFDYNKLDEAMDRNIVFFDKDAARGEFTPNIFCKMSQYAVVNPDINARIYRLYLPAIIIEKHKEANLIESKEYPDSDTAKFLRRCNEFIFGIEAIPQPDDVIHHWDKQGGYLGYCNGHTDIHIVIGETVNGKYIVGSC